MGHAAEDRRKFERFEISAPAIVEITGEDETLQFYTRDISAGGAFLHAAQPITVGIKLKIEIIIPTEDMDSLTGSEFQLRVYGTVVRNEQGGMAIRFSGQEILPMGSMMDN